MLRGGILISIGNSPEMLSQAILVGIILVGRLGVPARVPVMEGENSNPILSALPKNRLSEEQACAVS